MTCQLHYNLVTEPEFQPRAADSQIFSEKKRGGGFEMYLTYNIILVLGMQCNDSIFVYIVK